MTLTIPYQWSNIEISTAFGGDLDIKLSNSSELVDNLFNQLMYGMSYDDIIRLITPQSFENIMEHYKTDYKEE